MFVCESTQDTVKKKKKKKKKKEKKRLRLLYISSEIFDP